MLDFGKEYAHVDSDVLQRAAQRTRETLEAQVRDWAWCRGDWVIGEHLVGDSVAFVCIWTSAWEIDWFECQSSTEALALHQLAYESEQYCETLMKRMVSAEQTDIVAQWIKHIVQLPLPVAV